MKIGSSDPITEPEQVGLLQVLQIMDRANQIYILGAEIAGLVASCPLGVTFKQKMS